MIKFIVFWVIVNSFISPCPEPPTSYNEFGIENRSNVIFAITCYGTEILNKQKEFSSYEEAITFVEKGKLYCEGRWDCNLRSWRIEKITVEKL